jgi:hypothetical protein
VVLPKKQAPERPERVDGAPNQSNVKKPAWHPGFARTGVKIEPHAVEAEFSRLEAHDNAQLVNKTLYVDVRGKARLNFMITSTNSSETERGDVRMPRQP